MNNTADGCPSCSTIGAGTVGGGEQESRVLKQWPIQLKLIGTAAPFLRDADILVAADCTAFAVKDFHDRFLGGKKLLIGCPKLDNAQLYLDKFTEMLTNIPVRSVGVLRMEVPCCAGITAVLTEAARRAGRNIPLKETIVGVRGEMLEEKIIAE